MRRRAPTDQPNSANRPSTHGIGAGWVQNLMHGRAGKGTKPHPPPRPLLHPHPLDQQTLLPSQGIRLFLRLGGVWPGPTQGVSGGPGGRKKRGQKKSARKRGRPPGGVTDLKKDLAWNLPSAFIRGSGEAPLGGLGGAQDGALGGSLVRRREGGVRHRVVPRVLRRRRGPSGAEGVPIRRIFLFSFSSARLFDTAVNPPPLEWLLGLSTAVLPVSRGGFAIWMGGVGWR